MGIRKGSILEPGVTDFLFTCQPPSQIRTPLLTLTVALLATFVGSSWAGGAHNSPLVTLVAEAATLPINANTLPGMPPILNPDDIYAADRAGNLSPVVKNDPPRVYVPNSKSNSVTVIDAVTYQVIGSFRVGHLPQHVTPSYDLKTLWVLNDKGNSLTRVDPATGKPDGTIPVSDPYNMYYTPDGKYAIVVAERRQQLNFLDAASMKLYHSLSVPCKGVDHMDFSADGRYLIASCEFGMAVIKVGITQQEFLGRMPLEPHGMPQDVKLSPDGTVFYVADMKAGGVHLVDGENLRQIGFAKPAKVRMGFMSVGIPVCFTPRIVEKEACNVIRKWQLPGKASPDMGGVSADGKVLWLSGRFNSEVYAIDTSDGKLLARIPVGREPHGLCVYPQPGRYSLGHTGIFR